ncbi:hypothetical protein RWV98_17490 [Agathobaculum sp. NTUH-O15-33]|uniref:hypothetical protein n=1 Tax=Agathobaculum sp. NTUH-O15-33 TaxID=3079302 RepID=UPI002958CC53|nr:hypothetical protein [Agathobaculum sp. NTUH-O15-33]WNX84345.1 hypothetical protein RWV98_17490 [Agathobaculum sp. NTUH-O15-33]
MNAQSKKRVERLCQELSGECVDWTAIQQIIHELRPVINEPYVDGSILSELFLDVGIDRGGERLVTLTRLFLENGYSVYKNDGMNGGQCLHNLCWVSYDTYMLEVAKMLLDAGADPYFNDSEFEEEEEEGPGVLCSLYYKLPGAWLQCDYEKANIFETYRAIIESAQAGEDYTCIRPFCVCVGQRLTKAEYIVSEYTPEYVNEEPQNSFKNSMVLWFESLPLVVDRDIEFAVNPLIIPKDGHKRLDVSDRFGSVLGSKLCDFTFMDTYTVKLKFDNGYSVTFTNNYGKYKGSEIRGGFQISRKEDTAGFQPGTVIDGIYLRANKTYFDQSMSFCEESLLFKCGDNSYFLYQKEHDTEYDLVWDRYPTAWESWLNRTIELSGLRYEGNLVRSNQTVRGMRFSCDQGVLYLLAGTSRGICILLRQAPFAEEQVIQNIDQSEKLTFSII